MRQRDDEKKQRIENAVMNTILTEGFGGASVAKIAKEAGVSPATVYIYYRNKEDMIRSIFVEYSSDMWKTVVGDIDENTAGAAVIEKFVRNYYNFMTENPTVFSFILRFKSCPALSSDCSNSEYVNKIFGFIKQLKSKGVIKPYSDQNIFALIFFPVQMLSGNKIAAQPGDVPLLDQLIEIIQNSLLV